MCLASLEYLSTSRVLPRSYKQNSRYSTPFNSIGTECEFEFEPDPPSHAMKGHPASACVRYVDEKEAIQNGSGDVLAISHAPQIQRLPCHMLVHPLP